MTTDIVLVSNASMDLYPSNKLHDFHVRLPQPLTFDSTYRVAVTRVSFTKSYFNFNLNFGQGTVMQVMISENQQLYASETFSSKAQKTAQVLPGHYSPESFVEMINSQIKRFIKFGGTDEMKELVKYRLVNGFFECEPGTFLDKDGTEIKWEMKFDKYMKDILGIATEDRRPVFLNQGLTDLMLYCDLCYPSIVGDKNCDLLAVLDGQTDKPYGSHCSETFEDPWFHRLAKQSFQTVHVYIKTDTGQSPDFRFGRVNLRLTFKKEDAV